MPVTTLRAAGPRSGERLVSAAIYLLANLLGVVALVYPLWGGETAGYLSALTRAPMLLSLLMAFLLAALVFEAGAGLGPRAVAVLGVLVATNSVLRFVEAALPGPGGFSPVFLLILLTGYVYGPRFGFLMGALTLALSALVTGGVGPWLPYQMMAAGWAGLSAGWLPGRATSATVSDRRRTFTRSAARRCPILLLATFGALWGVLYGLAMTLWFWPFLDPGAALEAGTTLSATSTGDPVSRFVGFYLATSLGWDLFRSAGNAALILAAGPAVLKALERIGRRFGFEAAGGSGEQVKGTGQLGGGEQLSAERYQLSAISYQLSAISYQLSAVSCQLSAVSYQLSAIGREAGGALEPVHPYAWVAWLVAAAVVTSVTRHPLVLLTVALAIGAVRATLPTDDGRATVPVVRLAVVLLPLAGVYNLLMAHSGATVLGRLPPGWPLVGGPLTLEALVYGLLSGLSLVVLLAAFATFRLALSARALVRLIPRAFGSLTVVSAVALTYVPAVTQQLAAIREAQAVRGHRLRGVRDWVPLGIPLLVGSLERAFGLAESMTARGLASPPASPLGQWGVLTGLVALAVGWGGSLLGLVPRPWGTAVGVIGLLTGGALLLVSGRHRPFTPYRRTPWRLTDTLICLAAWAPLLVAWARPNVRLLLAYSPYPQLTAPPADGLLTMALVGLAAPAAVVHAARHKADSRAPEEGPRADDL